MADADASGAADDASPSSPFEELGAGDGGALEAAPADAVLDDAVSLLFAVASPDAEAAQCALNTRASESVTVRSVFENCMRGRVSRQLFDPKCLRASVIRSWPWGLEATDHVTAHSERIAAREIIAPMGDVTPSNATLDALFDGARSATVRTQRGMESLMGAVDVEFERDDLTALRDALRIRETAEQFHCMCLGDLVIDVRGRILSNGTLSFHHGHSLRHASWNSDAWLVDGPALLRMLASRGVTQPMKTFEANAVAERATMAARDEWVAAAPEAIRANLAEIERNERSSPAILAAIATLRESPGDDAAVARELLRWLAIGRGPWSGYASYEGLPMTLLRALDQDSVRVVATDPSLDDANVAAAARYFGSHDVVSFHKSIIAEVPDEFFVRARPIVKRGTEDDVLRFDHAQRVARQTREKRTRTAPYPAGNDCTVVGESTDGPLSGLAVLANGSLVSCDVQTIVRFDEGSIAPTVVARASEHFVLVTAVGDRPVWATINAGEVYTRRGEGAVERIAHAQPSPVEIASAPGRVTWLNRDAPGGKQIVGFVESEGAPRVLAEVPEAWMLAADERSVYFLSGGFNSASELRAVDWNDGAVRTICALPKAGPSMGTPRLLSSNGEVLVAFGTHLEAVDTRRGTRRELARTKKPLRAIAATRDVIAMLVGDDSGDGPWEFASVSRGGGDPKTIGRFERAPYHRHPLVLARGMACTPVGDRILGAGWGRSPT